MNYQDDPTAVELVREAIHLPILIELLLKEKQELEQTHVTLKEVHVRLVKTIGSAIHNRLQEVKRELRERHISVWNGDQSGEVLMFHVAANGKKSQFGIKRTVMEDEINKMIDRLGEKMKNLQFPTSPYKAEVRTSG